MKFAAKLGLSRAMVRLICGHIGLHGSMAGMRMAAPLLALHLGYATVAVGILVALFAVGQMSVAIPAARLVERRPLRPLLTCCALIASAGIGLSAMWPHFALLCVSALACGGAMGISLIAMQRHVSAAAASRAQLRQAFSWLSVAPSIAVFTGTAVAGVMIDLAGYRAAFLLLALLPLVTLVLARLATEAPIPSRDEAQRASPWSLWRDAPFRRLLMLNALMTSCWDLHGFMVPVIGHERGLSASAIGILLSAFALAATLSRLAVPLVAQRMREWTLIATALAMSATLFALYPFLPGHVLMLVCSFLLGILLGGIQPTVMVLLHQITPEHRHGDAMAMRFMMINASAISMPMLFGAAGGLMSASGVFVAAAVVVGTGAAIGLRSGRSEGREPGD